MYKPCCYQPIILIKHCKHNEYSSIKFIIINLIGGIRATTFWYMSKVNVFDTLEL